MPVSQPQPTQRNQQALRPTIAAVISVSGTDVTVKALLDTIGGYEQYTYPAIHAASLTAGDTVIVLYRSDDPRHGVVLGTISDASPEDALYVRRDGTLALSANWDIGDTRRILGDGFRARDAAGVRIEDQNGNLGVFVEDGGNVGFKDASNPSYALDILQPSGEQLILRAGQTGVSNGFTVASDGSALTFQFAGGRVLFAVGAILTIASGAISVTHSLHRVDTESSAASDNLDTINGGSDGQMLLLRTANSNRDVVVKHNTGNILLNGAADFTIGSTGDILQLVCWSTVWFEIGRTDA